MTRKVIPMLLAALTMISLASANLVVTGAYYDPIQSETGGEAIQLENLGESAVNLADIVLQTKSGRVNLPQMTLAPGGALLIADTGWSGDAGLRDNLTWPGADVETPLSLANTASWVETRDRGTNDTIHRLEWNSTNKAPEGRLFTEMGAVAPFFRNSSSSVTIIPVTIVIANGPPIIGNVTVTDDTAAPGVQWLSYARTIRVSVVLYEPNGESFSAVVRFNGRDTELIATSEINAAQPTEYTAEIPVTALAPGRYTLTVLASDGDATATKEIPVSVLVSSTLTVSGPLRFAGTPGSSAEDFVEITNEGNVERRVTVQRTPAGSTCTPLSFVLGPGESQTLYCSLTIPSGEPREIQERITILTQ